MRMAESEFQFIFHNDNSNINGDDFFHVIRVCNLSGELSIVDADTLSLH